MVFFFVMGKKMIATVYGVKGGRGGAKSLKGRGKNITRRAVDHDNFQAIPDPAFRRLARAVGITRIARDVYPETRELIRVLAYDVLKIADTYAEHGKRKTITGMDMIYALKRMGMAIYNVDGVQVKH